MQDVQPSVQPSSANEMAAVLSALNALKRGNSSVRLPAEWTGLAGKVAEVFNDVVEQNQQVALASDGHGFHEARGESRQRGSSGGSPVCRRSPRGPRTMAVRS